MGFVMDTKQLVSLLRRTRGWLAMVASDRPETSDIHTVLADVDEAIAALTTQEKPS